MILSVRHTVSRHTQLVSIESEMWPGHATRHRRLLRWAAAAGFQLPRLPIKAAARMLTFVPPVEMNALQQVIRPTSLPGFKYSIRVFFIYFYILPSFHIKALLCVYVSSLTSYIFRLYSAQSVSPPAIASIIISYPKVAISVFRSYDLH